MTELEEIKKHDWNYAVVAMSTHTKDINEAVIHVSMYRDVPTQLDYLTLYDQLSSNESMGYTGLTPFLDYVLMPASDDTYYNALAMIAQAKSMDDFTKEMNFKKV